MIREDGKKIMQSVIIPDALWAKLMPHQMEGIKFMFDCLFGRTHPMYNNLSGCILADTMGLGKTLQAITLISMLSKQNPYSKDQPYIKKCIIVAPVSLLGNWKDEFEKWLGDEIKPIVARSETTNAVEIIQTFM